MKYVIDSFAWLEYFMGTTAGEKARQIIESSEHEKLTPTICLSEIYVKSLKTEELGKAELPKAFIKLRSALVPLGEEIAVESAKIDVEMKKKVKGWGLADSIVLSTARLKRAKVVTGDEHFKGLEETLYIE
jgi:predicted nucleic acid-binding protein